MDKDLFINTIEAIIETHRLKYNRGIDRLKDDKLKIYLCGKSGSGKSSLINAILDLEKNEFPEVSKIGTLAKYTINWNEKYCCQYENETFEPMPNNLKERQQFLQKINKEDKEIEIGIPHRLLRKNTIIDIPGFFDYKNKNSFLNDLLDEADFVIFLKKFEDQLSPEEEDFLNNLKKNGIQYIVLFTFIDLRDPAILSEIDLNKDLNNKVNNYPNHPKYYAISNKIYFKNKEKSGILQFLSFFEKKHLVIKSTADSNKYAFLSEQYSIVLNDILNDNQQFIEKQIDNAKKKNDIDFSRKKNDFELNKMRFKNEIENLKEEIVSYIENYISSENSDENGLISLWKTEINRIIKLYNEIEVGEDISLNLFLPEYDPVIFNNIIIEPRKIYKELKELFPQKENEKKENENNIHIFEKIDDFLNSDISKNITLNVEIFLKRKSFIQTIDKRIEKYSESLIMKINNNFKNSLDDLIRYKENQIQDFKETLLEKYEICLLKESLDKISKFK